MVRSNLKRFLEKRKKIKCREISMGVSSMLKFPTQSDFKYKVGEKVFIDYKYRQDNGEKSEFVVLFQCTWYSDDELFYHIMNDDKNIAKIREIELISIEELRNRKINNIL